MPDKPTDKKLTFVEWLTKKSEANVREVKRTIKYCMNDIIVNGIHKYCKAGDCNLCNFQKCISNYHKYFKQK